MHSFVRNNLYIVIGFFVVLILGCYLRFMHLSDLSPHVDESGNISVSIDAQLRNEVAPREMGRPLLSFLFIPSSIIAKVLDIDYLLAARVQTSLTGLATGLILFWLLLKLEGLTTAFIGLTLWSLLPITALHERLALQDPYSALLLALCSLCIVLGSHAKRNSFAYLIVAGIFFGLGILNKVFTISAAGWLCGFIWMCFGIQSDRKIWLKECCIVVGTAIAIYVMFGFPDLELYSLRSQQFNQHVPLSQGFPSLQRLVYGISLIPASLYLYCGIIACIFFSVGCIANQHYRDEYFSLRLGFLFTICAHAVFFNIMWYSRYCIPDLIPLIMIVASGIGFIFEYRNKTLLISSMVAGLLGLTIISGIGTIVSIHQDPRENALSELSPTVFNDYEWYTVSFWSGYGSKSLVQYLDKNTQHHSLIFQPGWIAIRNFFTLRCHAYGNCSIFVLDKKQEDAAFILAYWWKHREPNSNMYFIDERFSDTNDLSEDLLPAAFKTFKSNGKDFITISPVSFESLHSSAFNAKSTLSPHADGWLAPRTSILVSSIDATTIKGSLPEGLEHVEITMSVDSKVIGHKTMNRSNTTFTIPPHDVHPGTYQRAQEVVLEFSDWTVIENPLKTHFGYFNAVRAVSYKIEDLK